MRTTSAAEVQTSPELSQFQRTAQKPTWALFVFKALLQEDVVQTDGCFAMGVPLSFPPSEPFFQVDVYF